MNDNTGNFNPRTPVGCDVQWALTYSTSWIFQSTHPSGVRPYARGLCRAPSHFNPRTPVGCDFWRVAEGVNDAISIHAPQWGATSWASSLWRWRDGISIHAPQWGATGDTIMDAIIPTIFQSTHPSGERQYQRYCDSFIVVISIHAPQWGATWQCRYGLAPHSIFQSTHPSGVRLEWGAQWLDLGFISIHAPQWGATFSGVVAPSP